MEDRDVYLKVSGLPFEPKTAKKLTIIIGVIVLPILAKFLTKDSYDDEWIRIVWFVLYPVAFLICYGVLWASAATKFTISAMDNCIYLDKVRWNFQVEKIRSVALTEIESLDGEDSVEVSYDKEGNQRVNRTYTLTLYGEFGQRNYGFGSMQNRSEAINAIKRAMEYLAEQVAE